MRRFLVVFFSLAVVPLALVVPLAQYSPPNAQHSLGAHVGKGIAGSGFDDFTVNDISSSGKWAYVGSTPLSFVPWQTGHQGIITFPTGITPSINELVGNQVVARPTGSFPGTSKCVVRFVIKCDALFMGSGFDGEWFMGIADPDGKGNVYAGAMLSFAPGFPEVASRGLLAGSYTSQINHTETPTNFTIAPNTWYDLVISWTPTVIKYYAATYGQTPVLIATNTTNISTGAQYLLIGNCRYGNGSPSVTLFIDRVEWLCNTAQSEAHLEEDLLKF